MPGNYYLIVRADIYDDIRETSALNNALASPATFEVAVPILVLGQTEDALLSSGQSLLYRLDVPADLTVNVRLDCDNDGAANELYARYGALPSSSAWDARYTGHLWADQTIRIPDTQPGSYYILARSISGGADMPAHITATEVPFSITDITPDRGGADRYVYLTVEGARFSPAAVLKLVRPQLGEYEPTVYTVRNASRIVAAFDLREAPRGLYDVVVTTPDGAEARLPYRFLVEAPLPIDLTVGLGGKDLIGLGDTAWYGAGVYSLTNIGTPYVHIEFGVPNIPNPAPELIPGAALEFRTNLTGEPAIDDVAWADVDPVLDLEGEYTAKGFGFDLVNDGYAGLSFSLRTYPGLDAILAENPSFLTDLDEAQKEMLSFDAHIYAAATPMTAEEYVTYQRALAAKTRDAIRADASAPAVFVTAAGDPVAWEAAWLAALTDAGLLRPEHEPPRLRDMPEFASLVTTVSAALLASPAGITFRSGTTDLASFFEQVRAWYGHDPEAFGGAEPPAFEDVDMGLSHPTHFEAFTIRIGMPREVTAVQPTDININDYFGLTGELADTVALDGPNGYGSRDLVPANTPLPYVLTARNPADAEVPVRTLRVYIQVPAGYDILTFRLGDLFLDGVQVNLPDNLPAFTGEFDLVTARGYVLRVTAGPDTVTNTLLWVLTAIDPYTGLPSSEAGVGLLSPGATATLGFTIRAHEETATGTTLGLSARVLFDGGTPLDTTRTANVLDAQPPVTTLVATALGGGDYRLDWSATDDAGGSGVRDVTVYGAVSDGGYRLLAYRSQGSTLLYDGTEDDGATFLAIAADNAGNLEALPAGVVAPVNFPGANLGAIPQAASTEAEPLPSAEPPVDPATNPLFLQAANQVPQDLGTWRRPAFATVVEPFVASAFAWGFDPSGGGIGPLGIAFHPDGQRVYISAGNGRKALYVFGTGGGQAGTPLADFDEPLYDLLFDADGMLWATTGGGPLLQIDPETGLIVARFGNRVTLGLAARPGTSQLYVATGDGVALFDTHTGEFMPFSSVRVDGLAVAPDGRLWGCAWPDGGQVLRFDTRGNAEIVLALDDEAEALAFGPTGSLMANLLFISHATGGDLTLVDGASLEHLNLASGGTRGDFLHVAPDGRLFVTQSTQVDVFQPNLPPEVTASAPLDQGTAEPLCHTASVTFNMDMDATLVTDPSHYLLTVSDGRATRAIAVSAVVYDPSTRTAYLTFAPLPMSRYTLTVTGLTSALGMPMAQAYSADFLVLEDLTADVHCVLRNTRLHRTNGTLAFEVAVENATDRDLTGVRVVFTGLTSDLVTPVNADGVSGEGHPYLDLTAAARGAIPAGESSAPRTLVLANPEALRLDPAPSVYGYPDPNRWPEFTSTPPTTAQVDVPYAYAAEATDPDGTREALRFQLLSGPAGAAVDAASGELHWTPGPGALARAPFALRVLDGAGAYAEQTWTVAVGGGNHAPVLSAIPDQSLRAGDLLALQVAAADADGDRLTYGADRLPPGAVFDPVTGRLTWQTGAGSAGRYTGVAVWASDGRAQTAETFTVVVGQANLPPVLTAAGDLHLIEGQAFAFTLHATDPDGDPVRFGATGAPAGLTVEPDSGRVAWTPGFDQHGAYAVTFTATDGDLAARDSATLTVENRNGPLHVIATDRVVVAEGQLLSLVVEVRDPDQPGAGPAILLPDGTMDSAGLPASLTWSVSGLPDGATFNTTAQTLTWQPGYSQAGTYPVVFHVADDGDGTGIPSTLDFTLTILVRDANAAPVLASVGNRSVAAGATVDITATATDPDGTVPTLTVSGLPAFATFTDRGDGTAALHAAPALADRRDYVISITASDDGSGNPAMVMSDSVAFVLSVEAPNAAPVLAHVGDRVALIGQALAIGVSATDLDEDPLTFGATGLPAGASLVAGTQYGTAEVRWTPAAGDAGDHALTLRVTDTGNGNPALLASDSEAIVLHVRSTNTPPVLMPVGNRQIAEGATLTIALSATDADNDAVTFSAAGLPDGAALDAATGHFAWTPSLFQAGAYTVRFTASDGVGISSEDTLITVTPTNQAPRLPQLPTLAAMEGTPMQFSLVAGDPDGDPVVVTLDSALPPGATFQTATLTFAWTPPQGQSGTHTVTFRATDAGGASSTMTVTIDVQDRNLPPQFPQPSGHVALVGQPFTLQLEASDPDEDGSPAFTATPLPSGAALTPAGLLTWTPTAAQLGTHDLLVTASDGSLSTSRVLRLVVRYEPVPPTVHIELSPSFPAAAGRQVLVHVTAEGVADIATLAATLNGAALTLDSQGRARVTPASPGHYAVRATATDIDGVTGSATTDLRVRDLTDTASPEVAIGTPTMGAILHAASPVAVTVRDDNLDTWILAIAPLAAEAWTALASGSAVSANATVATLDPQALRDGAYRLRLRATDMASRSAEATAVVDVFLPGRDVLVVTDLEADGWTLRRRYDALDAQAGLLGTGWSLAGFELNAEDNLVPDPLASLGPAAAYQDGTRLYLDLPDGSRAAFTFAPVPSESGYAPAWVPEAGVSAALETAPALLEKIGREYVRAADGLSYNPANAALDAAFAYRVALPDGTAWEYTAAQSLAALILPDGTRQPVGDSGAGTLAGAGLQVVTDTAGRASFAATESASVQYRFGAAGRLASVVTGQRTAPDTTLARTWYGWDATGRLASAATDNPEEPGFILAADGTQLPVHANAGVTRAFLGNAIAGALVAGQGFRQALVLDPVEFASATTGAVYLGLEVTTAGGWTPALPAVLGASVAHTVAEPGRLLAILELTQAGVVVLDLHGSQPADAGDLTLDLFLPGDTDLDGDLDGDDLAAVLDALGTAAGAPGYSLATDADRDGVIQAEDLDWINLAFGFTANRAPVVNATTVPAVAGLPITLDLAARTQDPDGDRLAFYLDAVDGGTAVLLADGRTLRFTPDAARGTGTIALRTDDGGRTSATATLTIDAAELTPDRLNLAQRDLALQPGEAADLGITAAFAGVDPQAVPGYLASITSSNPDVAVIAENGSILAVGNGTAILTATFGGCSLYTPVTVGPTDTRTVQFMPESRTLAVDEPLQFLVEELVAGQTLDRSAAAAGTSYHLSRTGVGAITPNGLFAAEAEGRVDVTLINGGKSLVATLRVAGPVANGSAVGPAGGIVEGPDGVQLAVPAGALGAGVPVTVTVLDAKAPPMPLPEGFTALSAFSVSLGGESSAEPIRVSLPAPAGRAAGPTLLFRFGKRLADDGSLEDGWELLDVLDAPPAGTKGKVAERHWTTKDGLRMPGLQVDSMLYSMTTTSPGWVYVGCLNLSSRMEADSKMQITVDPETGVGYQTVHSYWGDMGIPIAYKTPELKFKRPTPKGLTMTSYGIEIDPGQTLSFSVNAPMPATSDWRPAISHIEYAFTADGPKLTVTAMNLSPSVMNNQLEFLSLRDADIDSGVTYLLGQNGIQLTSAVGTSRTLPLPVAAGTGATLTCTPLALYYCPQAEGAPAVYVLDPVDGELRGTLPIPRAITRVDGLAANDEAVFLLDLPQKLLVDIEAASGDVRNEIFLPNYVLTPYIAYDSVAEEILFVAGTDLLGALDPDDWHTGERYHLGIADVAGLGCSPDGLVVLRGNGQVLRLDTATGAVREVLAEASSALAVAACAAPLTHFASLPPAGATPGGQLEFKIAKDMDLVNTRIRFKTTLDYHAVTAGAGAKTTSRDYFSEPVELALPPAPYVYVANSGDDTVGVIDTTLEVPDVVARIPVGRGPYDLIVAGAERLLLVTNSGEGTLSVINTQTMGELDMKPETPGTLDRVSLGGSPGPIAIGQQKAFVYIGDLSRPVFHQIGLGSLTNGQTHDLSTALPGITLTSFAGVGVSSDGHYVYLATPGAASWRGTDNVGTQGYLLQWDTEKRLVVGSLALGAKPFGVRVVPRQDADGLGKDYVLVAVRGSEPTGFTVVDPETMAIVRELTQATNLRGYEPLLGQADIGMSGSDRETLTETNAGAAGAGLDEDVYDNDADGTLYDDYRTNLAFVRADRRFFDIESAEDIAITADQTMGFALFNCTFQSRSSAVVGVGNSLAVADLQRDPHRGRGGNIGIILDPMDKEKTTGFIAATDEYPFSWPDQLFIGPTGQHLYASYKGINKVMVYDIYAIRAWIEALKVLMPTMVTRPKPGNPYALKMPLEEIIRNLTEPKDDASLWAFLGSGGTGGRDEMVAMFKGHYAADPMAAFFDYEAMVIAYAKNLVRDLPPKILVARIGAGRLPAGMPDSADYITHYGIELKALSATWAVNPLGDKPLELRYLIRGLPAPPIDIAVYRSDDDTLDETDPQVHKETLTDLDDRYPGYHAVELEVTDLANGHYLVALDPQNLIPEVDEDNNLAVLDVVPFDLALGGTAAASLTGTFLAGVDGTLTIDLDLPATTAATAVEAELHGTPVTFALVNGVWTAQIDLASLAGGEILTVQPVDSQGNPVGAARTYTLSLVTLPAWLSGPETGIEWDDSAGVYHVFRATSTRAAGTLPPDAPLCGGSASALTTGTFIAFDLANGAVSDLHFGGFWTTTLFGSPVPALSGAVAYDETGSGHIVESAVPGPAWWQMELRSRLGAFPIQASPVRVLSESSEPAAIPALEAAVPIINADLTLGSAGTLFDLDLVYASRLALSLAERVPAQAIPLASEDLRADGRISAAGSLRIQTTMAVASGQPTAVQTAVLDLTLDGGATLTGQTQAGSLAVHQDLALDTATATADLATDITATARRGAEVRLLARPLLHADDLFDHATWQWLPDAARGRASVLDTTAAATSDGTRSGSIDLTAAMTLGSVYASTGEPVRVTLTVTNTGDAPSPACQGLLVWSRDALVDANDAVLDGAIGLPALSGGDTWTQTLSITLPGSLDGQVWIGLAVDPSETVPEADETNNQALEAVLIQPLRTGTAHDAPATALDMGLLAGPLTIPNLVLGGPATAGWFRLELPATGTAAETIAMGFTAGSGTADLQLYDALGYLVALGATAADTPWESVLTLDGLEAGTYWLRAGSEQTDIAKYDLATAAAPRTGPDLIIATLAPPRFSRNGEAGTVWGTVTNQGNQAAPPFMVRLECSGSGAPMASLAVPGLPAGSSVDITVPFTTPSDLFVGSTVLFTLTADATNAVAELAEANNGSLAAPSLVAGAADALEAAQAADGAADLGVIRGTQATNGLSIDSPFDLDCLRFQLAAGGTAGCQARVTPGGAGLAAVLLREGAAWAPVPGIPDASGITVDLNDRPAGSYRLCVRSQGGSVASYGVSITGPDAAGANLLVTQLVPTPAETLAGTAVTVAARVANNGTTPAAACEARLYLSADDTINPAEDTMLGTPIAIAAVAAGAVLDLSQAVTVPAGTSAGWRRLALVVDSGAAVPESAETDNTRLTWLAILPPADPLEANDQADAATSVTFTAGSWTQSGLSLPTGDEDWFGFALGGTGSSSQSIRLAFAATEGPVALSVYDLAGIPRASAQSYSRTATVPLRGLPAGTYRVQVTGLGRSFLSDYAIAIGEETGGKGLSYCTAAEEASEAPPQTAKSSQRSGGRDRRIPAAGYRGPALQAFPAWPGTCLNGAGVASPSAATAEQATPAPRRPAPADASRTAALIRYAVDLWAQASGQPADLRLTYEYADLPPGRLAGARITASAASGRPLAGHLVIDRDANGRGWFAAVPPARAQDAPTGPVPAGRYDLLSLLCHEVGHILGFQADRLASQAGRVTALGVALAPDGEHLQADAGATPAMLATLRPGERRLPTPVEGRLLAVLADPAPATAPAQVAFRARGTTDDAGGRVLYARAGSAGTLGFVMFADDLVPEPLPQGVANGHFTVTNPADPAFGWNTNGPVSVSPGQAVLSEGAALFTDLSQTFAIPAGARTLRLTLTPSLEAGSAGALPEAVEVALLSREDGSQVIEPVAGLADGDALLNLQADGTVWLSPAATVVAADPVTSGSPIDLDGPLQVLISLPAQRAGTPVTLCIDLIGSGRAASSLTVTDVDSRDQEAFVLRLGRGWNAFAIPLQVADPSLTSVLSGVDYARTAWTFDAALNAYVPVAELLPGQGYFVLALQPAGISLFGTRPTPDWAHLIPGWNLVGSPDGSRPPGADTDLWSALWRVDPRSQTSQRVMPDQPLDPAGAYWFWLEP